MIITCPRCGFDNEVSGSDADVPCGRCEANLRASRSGRPETRPEMPREPDGAEPKKGSGRVWVMVIIIAAKGLLLYHLLGGDHRNAPPPAQPLPLHQMPAMRQPRERIMLSYELFEPEELPARLPGQRTFSVKFHKLDPAKFRPVPFLNVTVGDRRILQTLDPALFQGPAEAKTITFSIPAGELPRAGGEMGLQLMIDPRQAGPGSGGVESNSVPLELAAAP